MQTASTNVFRYQLFGIKWARSIATRAKGGRKIVTFKKIRLIAVLTTASLAHNFDFPRSSPVVGCKTEIPFCISVCLMKYAFRKPALAHAKNELTLFRRMSLAPVVLAAVPASIFLIASPIEILETQAAT